jgi:hypothetical protein
LVGAGGYDVDDAARGVPELGARPGRNHLELLDRIGDVNRRALAAHLLAEEPVGVVAAVGLMLLKTPLAGEGDRRVGPARR